MNIGREVATSYTISRDVAYEDAGLKPARLDFACPELVAQELTIPRRHFQVPCAHLAFPKRDSISRCSAGETRPEDSTACNSADIFGFTRANAATSWSARGAVLDTRARPWGVRQIESPASSTKPSDLASRRAAGTRFFGRNEESSSRLIDRSASRSMRSLTLLVRTEGTKVPGKKFPRVNSLLRTRSSEKDSRWRIKFPSMSTIPAYLIQFARVLA